MEALVNDASFEFVQMGFQPDYDVATNSFSSPAKDGVPVRSVAERRLPARDEDGTIDDTKFDLFTGIIDAVTGEALHGVRHYSLTGELYEGKFRGRDAIRHGDGAIVKNICLPPQREVVPELLGELSSAMNSSHNSLSFETANFYGTFENDEPSYGTLVTDSFTYRGHFSRKRFHGFKGEMIQSNGYTYIGEFQEGLFHGMGREVDPNTGEYQGEFRNGMKHGMGTFKEGPPEDKPEPEEAPQIPEQTAESIQAEMDKVFENKDWGDFTDSDWNPEDEMELQARSANGIEDSMKTPSSRYIYSGLFHCNQRQGEGTEWTPEGEIYSGQFLANRRHGHGSLKFVESGITHEGKWRAGEPVDGNGWRILYPSGDIYCGHVKNYKPHGYGIYQHASGDVYSGDWTDGQRNGNGIHSDPNGSEFTGRWKNDKVVTLKRLEETDGTLSEIAETLRIKDLSSSKDGEQNAGDGTEEDQNCSEVQKREKQLSFLKQAMAKSIETSLHIITSKSAETVEVFESFTDSVPDTRRRIKQTNKKESKESKARAELHSYANGDTYLGALDPETFQRTGYGVYVSKATGCSYTGVFKNNKRHGFGILIHSQFGKFAGEFHEDKKHGEGTLILSDSSSYHGGFANGAFDGKGTLCERDGTVYVGEWRAGLRNGEGMETMADGRVYKGTFKNGKREGNGMLLEKSAGKIIYCGPWRDGRYHGEGTLIERKRTPSSSQVQIIRWSGEFNSGKKHGYGVLINETDNSEWKGVWSNDKPVGGKWRVKYADGGLYSGQAQVLEDRHNAGDKVITVPDGFGTFQYPNGDVYVGNFEYGIRNGIGTCKFSSGEQWEGAWLNDHLDKRGSGVLTLADGTVHEFKGKSSGSIFSGRIESSNYM